MSSSDANAKVIDGATIDPADVRKHYTAVFEYDIRKFPVNPFAVDTPWGRALAVGVGNAFSECDTYREALEAIADGDVSPSKVESFAQEALDMASAEMARELERAPTDGAGHGTASTTAGGQVPGSASQ